MKANPGNAPDQGNNIVPMPVPRRRAELEESRFSVAKFINATGSISYRVAGYKRTGERVRVNYADEMRARAKQLELETEYLKGKPAAPVVQATSLTETQIRIAEACFIKLGIENPAELLSATDYWITHGRQASVPQSPRIDDAFTQFKTWLDSADMRKLSKTNLRQRVDVFVNSVPNIKVSDFTPESIQAYLDGRAISETSKDNDRRAICRFFSWCIERPRRWAQVNPAKREVRQRRAERNAPDILSVAECEKLLRAAEAHQRGKLVPYVTLCLFGGLRPFEAGRMTWDRVNLADKEIRLEASMTKTRQPRVVAICDTLAAWLERYKGKPFYPAAWRRQLDTIKLAAGLARREPAKSEGLIQKVKRGRLVKARRYWRRVIPVHWAPDILRHTAISHFFRDTGSYGKTAEQFGNSEAIIKRHYQGRVSSEDTERFYAILPSPKKSRKRGISRRK